MKTDYKQQMFRHPKMRELLEWLEEETGVEFIETSSRRINDKGVHGTDPCRGVDLRMRDKSLGTIIELKINREWIYDPARTCKKCAMLHGKGGNMHLHLQVHDNTVRV